MKIRYEESFEKDLKAIKDKKLRVRIKRKIDEVKTALTLKNVRNIRKLRGYETYYRIKLGEFRVGIELEEDIVIFVRFLHRKDIYRYFP